MIKALGGENNRYKTTLYMAHFGWWATIGIVTLRAFDIIPQTMGSMALLTLGVGVTSSLSLSRYRLGQTIAATFQAGMRTAITLNANVFTDTCIMSLDRKGRVESVDHADAIGWNPDELVGRELRTLLAPRSMGVRKLEAGTSITSPMYNQDGKTFDARINMAALSDNQQESLPGIGDPPAGHPRLIVTVSPIVSSDGSYELRGSG